ncbi:MAG: hypothetical protein ACOY46_16005 [Bacillota bacterium]
MKKILKSVSLLIIGIIIGSVGSNLYIGRHIDYLTLTNKTLQDSLADAERELQNIKEADKKRKYVISGFDIFLMMDKQEEITDYDELTVEFEVNKKVKEWLNPLIGQRVEDLDTLLIPRIIDNREIAVNGNMYRLRTYIVVVNQKTSVYIKSTRIKSNGTM